MASGTAAIPAAKPTLQLSDAELQASFSLLPSVMKLAKALYNGADTQSIHATSVELSAQLQKCRQLLDSIQALSLSPAEQELILNKKKKLLVEKNQLLKKFKEMDILQV